MPQPAAPGVHGLRHRARFKPVQITTQPHPGFPTDLQAQFMALLCLAQGNSVITEKIFPERFLHVAELTRMGASIHRHGTTAVISGREGTMTGAPVMASDLRASAGLVLAAMASRRARRSSTGCITSIVGMKNSKIGLDLSAHRLCG